jgi:hypothetical protein
MYWVLAHVSYAMLLGGFWNKCFSCSLVSSSISLLNSFRDSINQLNFHALRSLSSSKRFTCGFLISQGSIGIPLPRPSQQLTFWILAYISQLAASLYPIHGNTHSVDLVYQSPPSPRIALGFMKPTNTTTPSSCIHNGLLPATFLFVRV